MNSLELVKQAIATKGKANLSFKGISMYPTLKDSMMLTISRIPQEAVKISDIIAYQQDSQIVAHRVINIIRNNGEVLFITKGDNQPFGGVSRISQRDLIGKVERAFYQNFPANNILNKNNFYCFSYLCLGRAYLFYRKFIRRYLSDSLRIFLRTLVGNLYICFQAPFHKR